MTQYDAALAAHVNENWGNAQRLLDFLDDRRLLSEVHMREDASHSVRSALEIRSTMTTMMAASTPGVLKSALGEIRTACRGFVDAGGTHGIRFDQSPSLFAVNLAALQLAIARQVELVVNTFGLEPSSETKRLLHLIDTERRPGR